MAKSRRKMFIMIGVALIVVLFVGAAAVKASQKKQDTGDIVKTAAIAKQDIEAHILTSGEVVSIEKRDIVADVSEKIEEILVKEGDQVEAGQALVKLASDDLEYQMREAEIRLAMEKDNLQQMTNESYTEMEISLSNAEIKHQDAQTAYDNNKKLYESGAVSKSELDKAKSTLDQNYNDYLLAKRNLENAKTGSKLTAQEKQVNLSELAVEKLQTQLEKYTVKSPIAGKVTNLNGVVGSLPSENTSIMSIVNTNNLEIVTNISEYDIHKIALGQKVKITGDAFEGKEYKGIVKYIDSTAFSNSTGQGKETVVKVKIEVIDKDTALKPGFSASVDILTESKKGALVIPYEAIFTRKNGEQVIFTIEEGKAKEHIIKTGIESDLAVEVMGQGLKEKDLVIMNPTENLKDGDPVKENKVMNNDKN
jgi:RND family efflux transporter MFP subunit